MHLRNQKLEMEEKKIKKYNMDILHGNQVQVDEKDEPKEPVVEELLFSYYNQHFEHPQDFNRKSVDAHLSKWPDLASGRLIMEEGLDLSSSSSKPQAKRRKTTEDINLEVHGGGCRIIRPAGRKDCHSKVSTARGTRDRRLRLSPKTAIQFYDVQDRLGYDRPSKAIDWLMKEAKAAINALDNKSPPPPPVAACNNLTESYGLLPNGSFLKSGNDNAVISSFGFFTNDDFNSSIRRNYGGQEDISSIFHGNYHEDGILSAPPSANSWEIFDPNLEICRMQMFSQREPLQSSYSRIAANYSPLISSQFPGICFSNEEIQSLSAAATLKVDEMDKIPASSVPFSASSFLSYEK